MRTLFQCIWHIPRNIGCFFIRLYQKTLSPDHSIFLKGIFPNGYCKFSPSCSDYTFLALKKYGLIYGSLKGFVRIVRCNPLSEGGHDPL